MPFIRKPGPRSRRLRVIGNVLTTALATLTMLAVAAPAAVASHMLDGEYHWMKPLSGDRQIVVRLDNVQWLDAFTDAQAEWGANTEFSFKQSTSSTCDIDADEGSLTVCDANYGNTGWIGLAEMVVMGRHIVRGRVRLNTYYPLDYHTARSTWCQEIGHFLGLDHRGDTGTTSDDADSCMSDHPSNPEHPDSHDLKQLNCQTHTSAETEPIADCTSSPPTSIGGSGGGTGGGGGGAHCLLVILLCHSDASSGSLLVQFRKSPPPGSFDRPRREL